MGLPDAVVIHQLEDRIRIRIPERRGDNGFFETLSPALASGLGSCELTLTPASGSLLIRGERPDLEKIFALAEKKGLFSRAESPLKQEKSGSVVPEVSRQIVSRINGGIQALTFGQLDLSLAAFVLLIGHALREIARGNLTAPSWFTALWVASNIYSSGIRHKAFGQETGDRGETGE